MHSWKQRLHRTEDALLVTLLTVMLGLAAIQILFRNLFDSGFVWIDPALRVLVLWLGLLGATVATRNNKHICIDLLTRYFDSNAQRLIEAVVGQVSAWTCLVIAAYGFDWVRLDYLDGLVAFAGVPAWALELIIPLSFGVIGLRYLIMSCYWARLYLRERRRAAGPAK